MRKLHPRISKESFIAAIIIVVIAVVLKLLGVIHF